MVCSDKPVTIIRHKEPKNEEGSGGGVTKHKGGKVGNSVSKESKKTIPQRLIT